MQKGVDLGKKEVAYNMIKKGLDEVIITEITGLDSAQIAAVKKSDID